MQRMVQRTWHWIHQQEQARRWWGAWSGKTTLVCVAWRGWYPWWRRSTKAMKTQSWWLFIELSLSKSNMLLDPKWWFISVCHCSDHSCSLPWFQLNHMTASHTMRRSRCKLHSWCSLLWFSWTTWQAVTPWKGVIVSCNVDLGVVRSSVKVNGDKCWEYVLPCGWCLVLVSWMGHTSWWLAYLHPSVLKPWWNWYFLDAKSQESGQSLMQKTQEGWIGLCCLLSMHFGKILLVLNANLTCCVSRSLIWDQSLWALQCWCISMLYRQGDILIRPSMVFFFEYLNGANQLIAFVLLDAAEPRMLFTCFYQWWDWSFFIFILLLYAELFHQVRMKSGCIDVDKVALLVGNHVECFIRT